MKKGTRTVTPKLRFPEFRDAEGWKHQRLGLHLEDCSSRVSANTNLPVYSSTREGLKRQGAYFNGKELLNKNEYGVVPNGCFVYRHMSDDGLFKFNINDTGSDIAVSKEYPVFRTKDLNSLFLLNMLNESPNFKWFAFSQKKGGTRTRLYFNILCGWKTFLPSQREQQKIAECLSSLDGLIAAEGRKLEALKAHKKGLMQQLFPQPGETQPRLRFPEFRGKGEWGESSLGKLLSRKPEYGVNAAAVPFSKDLPKYIRITDIDDEGQFAQDNPVSVEIEATEEHYLVEGDIVLARTGASVGKSYRYRQSDGRLVFAGFLIRVRPNPKKLVPVFLSNYLTTWQYWDWVRVNSARSGQPGINGSEYASMPVPLPPAGPQGNELAEQQKIADCLATVDTQITAQAAKINALKTHKRGLMQQLFPAPEEQ